MATTNDPADVSTGDLTTGLFARLSDFANPILVKEVRQALKSRQFVSTFMLLLVASWVVAVFGLALSGESLEYGSTGRGFFYAFYVVLAIATLLIIPFTAHRSLLAERDLNTFELLSITTLKPRQIVWGKLLSALVQLFIFYSAITPFIAFSSLLQGFDAPSAAYILVMSMLASLMLSMCALMLSTFVRQRVGQVFMMLVVLGGLGFVLMSGLGIVYGQVMEFQTLAFDDADFWWFNGFLLLTAVSYFVLLQQITTAQLTFESDNRSTGIRLAAAGQFWLLWGSVCGYLLLNFSSFDPELLMVLSCFSAVHWAVFGLLFSTEEDDLSRRLLRDLPQRTAVRIAVAPLMPGGARGYLFLLLHVAALWLLVVGGYALFASPGPHSSHTGWRWLAGIATFRHDSWNDVLQFTTAVCCYLVLYVGLGTAMGRWGRLISGDIRAGHVRLLTFLALMAGIIFPYVPKAMRLIGWQGYTLIDITNPIATLAEIADHGSWSQPIVILLMVAALAMILVNLRAMQRGLAEVLLAARRPLEQGQTAEAPEAATEAANPQATPLSKPEVLSTEY